MNGFHCDQLKSIHRSCYWGGRGLRTDQAYRLKELERANARLKMLMAEQALDIEIMKEPASGN